METHVRDECGATDSYMPSCLGCGREFCYECRKIKTIDYQHGVFVCGSGDGIYCKPCDLKMSEQGATKSGTPTTPSKPSKSSVKCGIWISTNAGGRPRTR